MKLDPETVSTDYDEADRLYFENINLESVLDIYQLEHSSGVMIAMGGQTPNNIALPLHRLGVNILGTSPDMIDTAENRYKFSRMLDRILVDQPQWKELTSFEEAESFCNKVSYPVLVRPSYVLSGAAMNTVYSRDDLESYLKQAAEVSRDHPVVITKYIENAKEIEMDAVAQNGKMIGHFISEHVENAGVHSGDATLILPPQDLDPTTISRIEEATRKIGNALNVTGPFNIQFIAKDNEIKVIECNVRASRSFPFVSKVMGVDLIEMATKAMLGLQVAEYPPTHIPKDYVGVKVPQFSFSRLSGADPVLGVEMASTGEVACFGRDKYEAYLKALISTGFRLPNRNILLSIGSYKDKVEMIPSIRRLHEMGYKIHATAGTADFIQEHGVPVKYLEILANETENQKSEYSLTQHLANNLIDLYINLPSSNKFRRPANYLSTGYQTRRMAVDYQVPLVTNVKNAKILIEAIARHFDLEIVPMDAQTSHQSVTLPGLINIAAFVPGLVTRDSTDFETVSKASLAAGFSMIRIMPLGVDGSITDARALSIAQANSRKRAYCDYNFSVAATADNSDQIAQITGQVGSLVVPFNHLSGNISKVAAITAHFDAWPAWKPLVTDAKNTDLYSLLLFSKLHDRKLHVMSVSCADDIKLIALCKDKGQKVTCDVSVYALFITQKDFPECKALPTAEDQQALWKHMEYIDIFSVGTLPFDLARCYKRVTTPDIGIADTIPLLFTAVSEGRLTVDDIKARLHDNPKRIFDLHEQDGTTVEIELDRLYHGTPGSSWLATMKRTARGCVKRVMMGGTTACLDGEVASDTQGGRDMSTHMPVPGSPEVNSLFSPSLAPRSETSLGDRRGSLISTQLTSRPRTTDGVSQQVQPGQGHSSSVPHEDIGPPLYNAPTIPRSVLDLLSNSSFRQKHVLAVQQFKRQDLHHLFTVAQEMRLGVQRQGVLDILRGRVLTTLFYEASTRTSASFDAAMQRLGGRTIAIATQHSSTQKGESLQDTIRTLGCYGDAIVLRHPDPESAAIAAKYSPVPVINGGNGSIEHPTQAFLDLFTIREELGTVQGLTVTFVGDLRYGRTVHSLIKLLAYYNVKVQLIAPKAIALPSGIRQSLIASGQLVAEAETLEPSLVERTDVLYCTRVQKERFETPDEYDQVKDSIVVNSRVLKQAKPNMIVMHPLPRNNEIDPEVDTDPRAAYFRQMEYGLYCRMALLALVMAP
jgi:carbamoyl-phosphate synthase/aspartate carbamoyltransferase